MKEIPKVSVIVPVYRAIEYIGELLSSLQNRMQRAMQFVYVDVKAGDGSFDIVREAAQHDNHRPNHFFILRRVYSKPADSARQVAPIRCDLSGMRDDYTSVIRRKLNRGQGLGLLHSNRRCNPGRRRIERRLCRLLDVSEILVERICRVRSKIAYF